MTITVIAVIPGHNVEETVSKVIKKAKKHVNKVIYVDDGSWDRSADLAKRAGAEVISLLINRGKGVALRTGMQIALQKGADVVITLDSDGQHDPNYIPKFLQALQDADLVIGSRYAGRFYTIPRNVLGNYGLNFITNMLSYGPQGLLRHQWLGDTQSGFRAIRASALKKLNLRAKKYEIEGEMILEAAKNHLKIKEIPITGTVRTGGVTVCDGIRNAIFIFKRRFVL
jgi:glycosyltransferase involved in cell wall biosynthesis